MPARACLLLLACVCAHAHMRAKEYICQDPDTGTLHGINTTWRSTSFCGNYSCKLRTVNTTQPTSKITVVNLFDPQARTSQTNDKKNHTNEFSLTKILPELSIDNDRLLNKAEINKITELLHTVKKSDLQAVIELYNVAQDIYKDMKVPDGKTPNFDATANSRASEAKLEDPVDTFGNKISYWYEPLNEHRKVADMNTEGSTYKDTTVYPHRRPYIHPYYYAQSNPNPNYPSYFTGSLLTNGDFGRLGYYNPQANPQNVPAYPQQRTIYDVSGTTPQSPCNPCSSAYQYQTPVPANYPQRANMNPYPPQFYNYTQGYNNYYKGNPWAYYDYYRNYPYQTASQIQRNPVIHNAEVVAEKMVESNEKVKTETKEESWKTDPLTDEVINEIRANIAQRGKLINIPLKKRIKLERAAKVIKLDQFNRKTRSISDKAKSEEKNTEESSKEVLEAYVEKVTCEPTTELGYFKMGNLTKPFPDCCPQKIVDKL